MQISCTYRGKEKEWESSHLEMIIGGVEDQSGRSLDLTPDSGVPFADVGLTTGTEYRIQLREFA